MFLQKGNLKVGKDMQLGSGSIIQYDTVQAPYDLSK